MRQRPRKINQFWPPERQWQLIGLCSTGLFVFWPFSFERFHWKAVQTVQPVSKIFWKCGRLRLFFGEKISIFILTGNTPATLGGIKTAYKIFNRYAEDSLGLYSSFSPKFKLYCWIRTKKNLFFQKTET